MRNGQTFKKLFIEQKRILLSTKKDAPMSKKKRGKAHKKWNCIKYSGLTIKINDMYKIASK